MPRHAKRSRAFAHAAGASLLLAFAGGAVLAGTSPGTDAPVARTFSDWSLTCDNLRRCVAMSADRENGRLLIISRDAGAGASPTIELVGGALPVLEPTVGHGPVRYPSPAWSVEAAELDVEILRTTDLAAAQGFVDTVRNAAALRAQAPAGEDLAGDDMSVSLKGLSASLLLMDEVQGRLGTRGALLRRGAAPETTVPPAPALPALTPARAPQALDAATAATIAAAVRKAQSGELRDQDCDDAAPQDAAWALTDSQALVYLGCWMGAYQGSGPLFIAQRQAPHAARRLLLDNPATGTAVDMLTSADYEPATATLQHFGKGRGLGDCGESASWVFDGTAFRLARYAALDACAGLPPDRWPTRWRTRMQEGSR